MRAVFAQPRPDRERGVFETLLVLSGRAVELEAHLERLGSSLAELYPEMEPPPIAPLIEAGAEERGEGALRVTATPGEAGIALAIDPVEVDRRLVLPETPRAVSVHSVEVPGGLGSHKWADRTLLERAGDVLPADTPVLIVDRDGTPLEASRANLFVVRGGALLTPPTDARILPGVTRRRVLGLAAELDIEAMEVALRQRDLLDADEVFLTGSVRGVERVAELDGRVLGQRGDAAARLATGLRRAWRGGLDRVPRR